MSEVLLQVKGLKKYFPIKSGLVKRTKRSRPGCGRADLQHPAGQDPGHRG